MTRLLTPAQKTAKALRAANRRLARKAASVTTITTDIELTSDSHKLFASLAAEAADWGGEPMIDITPAQRGNLADLKKKGLLTTGTSEGVAFARFTDTGRQYAAAHNIKL